MLKYLGASTITGYHRGLIVHGLHRHDAKVLSLRRVQYSHTVLEEEGSIKYLFRGIPLLVGNIPLETDPLGNPQPSS